MQTQTSRYIETRLARLGLSFEDARQKALRHGWLGAASLIFPKTECLRDGLANMLRTDALSRAA
jgi:hypothetical protein